MSDAVIINRAPDPSSEDLIRSLCADLSAERLASEEHVKRECEDRERIAALTAEIASMKAGAMGMPGKEWMTMEAERDAAIAWAEKAEADLERRTALLREALEYVVSSRELSAQQLRDRIDAELAGNEIAS